MNSTLPNLVPAAPLVKAGEVATRETTTRRRLARELVLAALAVAVLNHCLAAELLAALQSVFDSVIVAAAALVVLALAGFLGGAGFLHRHRFNDQTTSVWWFVLVLASGDSIGVGLRELRELIPDLHSWLALVGGALLLAWALRWLRQRRDHWSRLVTVSRTLSRISCAKRPVTHLVVFLSPPTIVPEFPEAPGGPKVRFPVKNAVPLDLSGGIENLAHDIARMDNLPVRHNWQQILRAIQPHVGTLSDVFLVVSPDATGQGTTPRAGGQRALDQEGSSLYRAHGEKFLSAYLPNVRIHLPEAVDFEDSDRLHPLLESLEAIAKQVCKPSAFAIDVTGGQKTNSIVAAALTLFSPSRVQYVQTSPRPALAPDGQRVRPEIEAYLYDLRIDFDPLA